MRLRDAGLVEPGERVVVLNTASGLEYAELAQADLPVVPAGS